VCVSMSRLEIDAGNTFIKWRLREAGTTLASGRWQTADFRTECLQDCERRPDVVWLGSVAGTQVNGALVTAVAECWGLEVRQARTEAVCAGVHNSYADPARMGVDRWLAMLAGWQRTGGPCCVVDCGSAITIDILDAEGCHRGGYILPGLRLMQASLLGSTAEIRVEHDLAASAVLPGCSTEEGVGHGARLLLLALAGQIRQGLPGEVGPVRTLVTGGDAEQLLAYLPDAEHCPDLVLDGLTQALG